MYIDNMPEWYWKKGLFDAQITKMILTTLDYDYSQKNPVRNYFSIEINSINALNDTSIKEIRFINANLLTKQFDCHDCWWVNDSIIKQGEKYVITIQVQNSHKKFEIIIRFDNAIVIRE